MQAGKVDTLYLTRHSLGLQDDPSGHTNCRDNQNEWTKVVLKPGGVQ